MLVADRNSRELVTRSQIIVDAAARLSAPKSRLARSDFSRNFLTHFSRAPILGRRLPLVPLRTVALEPEHQVGSAVAATGLPSKRPCSNAADRPRPRGKKLGSKGIQVGFEHRRRRQIVFYIHF